MLQMYHVILGISMQSSKKHI